MSRVAAARFKEDLSIDDWGVIREQLRMEKAFGYVPAYASNLPDLHLAADQVQWLLRAFPGYGWKVQVRDGLLTCVNDDLAPDYGFNLKLTMLDNDGKVIRRFGSKLLEMFGMPESFKVDHWLDAPKTQRGALIRL